MQRNIQWILETPRQFLNEMPSNEKEIQQTRIIEDMVLQKFQLVGKESQKQLKTHIILELEKIIQEWMAMLFDNHVKKMSLQKLQCDEQQLQRMKEYQLIIFGSYKTDTLCEDSDVDLVCISPSYVSREEDFFGLLKGVLQNSKQVSQMLPVSETQVPILKFHYSGIPVDISFARCINPHVNVKELNIEQNPDDIKVLLHFDYKSIKSLNGIRNAETILNVVPHKLVFQRTLRLIKLWAKNRRIYGALCGYLGGISWAIMVAKMCQLFPNYAPSKLLKRFFCIYAAWPWQHMAVRIMEEQRPTNRQFDKLNSEQFDIGQALSMNPYQVSPPSMMILTPAFPSMNSAYSVNSVTFQVILNNLKESHEILNNKKFHRWRQLFNEFNLFKHYTTFIQVIVSALNKDELLVWQGTCESKLRQLTKLFEPLQQAHRFDFQPCPHMFYHQNQNQNANNAVDMQSASSTSVSFFYGLRIDASSVHPESKLIDLRQPIVDFLSLLETLPTPSPSCRLELKVLKRYELPLFLFKDNALPKWARLKYQQQQQPMLPSFNTMNQNENVNVQTISSPRNNNRKFSEQCMSQGQNQDDNNGNLSAPPVVKEKGSSVQNFPHADTPSSAINYQNNQNQAQLPYYYQQFQQYQNQNLNSSNHSQMHFQQNQFNFNYNKLNNQMPINSNASKVNVRPKSSNYSSKQINNNKLQQQQQINQLDLHQINNGNI